MARDRQVRRLWILLAEGKPLSPAARHLGVHILAVDLFAPGRHDPQGMHGAILERLSYDNSPPEPHADEPATFSSFAAGPEVEIYVERAAFGASLPSMPLFLRPDRYINVPLEATSQTAYADTPQFWRDVLEAPAPPK